MFLNKATDAREYVAGFSYFSLDEDTATKGGRVNALVFYSPLTFIRWDGREWVMAYLAKENSPLSMKSIKYIELMHHEAYSLIGRLNHNGYLYERGGMR